MNAPRPIWETGCRITALLVIAAAVAGMVGYRIGQQPQPPLVVINLLPQL